MHDFLSELGFTFGRWMDQAGMLAPRVVEAGIVFAVGWLLAVIFRRLAVAALRRGRFDVTSHRLGLSRLLAQGGAEVSPSSAIAEMLYWLVLAGALLQALSVLQIAELNGFIAGTVTFLEHLVIAFVIAAGGYVVSLFFGRAALIAAANAHLRPARWIGAGVQGLIILFTLALALEQLGLAPGVVRDAFAILFGGVVLALALAFGIGGRTVARDILEQRWKQEHTGSPDHPDDRPAAELRHQ